MTIDGNQSCLKRSQTVQLSIGLDFQYQSFNWNQLLSFIIDYQFHQLITLGNSFLNYVLFPIIVLKIIVGYGRFCVLL